MQGIRAIAGEKLRFYVSASDGNHEYLVDLLENHGIGRCSCTDHGTRRQPRIKNGERCYCKHVIQAREYFLNDLLKTLSEQHD